MPSLRIKRGTRVALDALKTALGLKQSELYHITDENTVDVGTAAGTSITLVTTDTAQTLRNKTLGATVVAESGTADALTIRNTGSGHSLLVEDDATPDATPFAITQDGRVLVGSTTSRVGFSSQQEAIQVAGAGGAASSIALHSVSDAAGAAQHRQYRRKVSGDGTIGIGDVIGSNQWLGWKGDAYAQVATIQARMDSAGGTPSTTNMPGRLDFNITLANTTVPTAFITLNSLGETLFPRANIGVTTGKVHTIPDVTSDTFTLNNATQTLNNKTIDLASNTFSGTLAQFNAACTDADFATGGGTATGTNTGDQIIPTTLPASDVYAWAKAETKPTYTAAEVGLGNVDNTSDADKPVSLAQQIALDAKEGTITTGSTSQFWRGDKTWRDFAVDVRAAVLTGLSTATSVSVSAADSVLVAIGKLQAQCSLKANASSGVLSNPTFNDGYTEEVFAITGTTPAISPTNGSIQTWTLTASSTPTSGTWANGQSITMLVDDGSANTINWSSIGVIWKTDGGSAPALQTTGVTAIALWRVGNVVYGARVGDA